jgi:RNA-directed DNA polymerase
MKESYGEGLATHTGLKSCGDVRKGGAEASTEVRAGQVFSRERTLLRGADAVGISGRPHLERRHRKTFLDPARSKTLCTLGNTMRGNREVLELSAGDGSADRVGKPKGIRR